MFKRIEPEILAELESSGLRIKWPQISTITTVSALGGFMLSTYVNGEIFSSWGVNFVQIASPSDVLMTGLATLYNILPGIILSILFCTSPISALLRVFNSKKYKYLIDGIVNNFILSIPFLAIGLMTSAVSLSGNVNWATSSTFGEIYSLIFSSAFPATVALLTTVFVCFIFYLIKIVIIFDNRLYESKNNAQGIPFILALFLSMLLIPIGFSGVTSFIRYEIISVKITLPQTGFLGSNYTFNTKDDSCGKTTTLWIGERGIVGRCENKSIVYLANPQALILLNEDHTQIHVRNLHLPTYADMKGDLFSDSIQKTLGRVFHYTPSAGHDRP